MAKTKTEDKTKPPKVKEILTRQIGVPFDTMCDIKDICNRMQVVEDITTEELIIRYAQWGVQIQKILDKKNLTFEQAISKI